MTLIADLNNVLRAASRLSVGVIDDDWSRGPRPPARATVHSEGLSPLRVLLFGGGPVVGYGVASHDLSLAGHLARQLTAGTGIGIDMDVVTGTNLRCRDMPRLIEDLQSTRYDLMFLSFGVQDALDFTAPNEWARDAERVIQMLQPSQHKSVPLFVIGIPPVSGVVRTDPHLVRHHNRRAALLDDALRQLCAATAATTFIPFEADTEAVAGRHRTSQTYCRWAQLLIPSVAPVLDSLPRSAEPDQDERARQEALDRLAILDTPREDSFDNLAAKAQRFFGVVGAGISFIDHERQWFKASVGIEATELPRAVGLCGHTIKSLDGLIVEDCSQDPRFAKNELVASTGVRSYAGVPIHDPHGFAVGAVCVFDDKSRAFTSSEMSYLRALAHLIERQLADDFDSRT